MALLTLDRDLVWEEGQRPHRYLSQLPDALAVEGAVAPTEVRKALTMWTRDRAPLKGDDGKPRTSGVVCGRALRRIPRSETRISDDSRTARNPDGIVVPAEKSPTNIENL